LCDNHIEFVCSWSGIVGIAEFAGLEYDGHHRWGGIAGLENDGLEFRDWEKKDCKLLNYMDIGCDTYIKV